MAGTAIQLLGIEQGNGTALSHSYDISSIDTDPVSRSANVVQENKFSFCI